MTEPLLRLFSDTDPPTSYDSATETNNNNNNNNNNTNTSPDDHHPINTTTTNKNNNNNTINATHSLRLVTILLFLGGIGLSCVTPTLWFRFIDDFNSPPALVGLAIALFYLGQFLGSTLFMFIYRKNPEKIRMLMICGFVIVSVSDFLYFCAPQMWILFVARFFSGFGSAYQEIIQEYVKEMSMHEFQSVAVGSLGFYAAASLILGPFITCSLSFIPDGVGSGNLPLNSHSLTGLVSSFLSATCATVLAFYDLSTTPKEENLIISTFDTITDGSNRVIPANSILILLIFMYFCVFMNSSVFETLVVPFTFSCYGWAEMLNSIFFVLSGTLSAFSFVVLEFLSDIIPDTWICFPFLALLGVGYLLLIPLRVGDGHCGEGEGGGSPVGCECGYGNGHTGDNRYIPEWRFIVACLVISISYHFSFVSLSKIFAKILFWMEPEDIKRRLRFLKNVGSVSVIIGPIWMSLVLEFWVGSHTFLMMSVLSFLCWLMFGALLRKLNVLLGSLLSHNVTYTESGSPAREGERERGSFGFDF